MPWHTDGVRELVKLIDSLPPPSKFQGSGLGHQAGAAGALLSLLTVIFSVLYVMT